jgi:competence protein ComEC
MTAPIATDGGTTIETASATAVPLTVEDIHADAEGNDRENLNDEYIILGNDGDEPIDLSGWTISDEAGHTYTVPDGVSLTPGETLTLHTGSGTNTETDLYWDSGSPVWNNGGDTIIITNSEGEEVLRENY